MKLKVCLFLLVFFRIVSAKSQILLDADSAKIKAEMDLQGGKFVFNRMQEDLETSKYCYVILYKFPPKIVLEKGIVHVAYYLTPDNKCYKYFVTYYNDSLYVPKLTDSFDKPNTGLKRLKDSLTWINSNKNYRLSILPRIPINGKIIPPFILEIEKTDN